MFVLYPDSESIQNVFQRQIKVFKIKARVNFFSKFTKMHHTVSASLQQLQSITLSQHFTQHVLLTQLLYSSTLFKCNESNFVCFSFRGVIVISW